MEKREEILSGLSYDEGLVGSEEVEFARLELVPSSGERSCSGSVSGISMSLSFPNGVSSKVEGLDSDTSALLLMELVSRCAPQAGNGNDPARV